MKKILAIVGGTLTFNPSFDQTVIDQAYEADPVAAASEYGAQDRSDVELYIPRQVVEACTVKGRFELPPVSGLRYFGFTDPSGGSRDSFTVAIAHQEKGISVLDYVHEIRPPFSPEDATRELCDALKGYGIREVRGDRYAGMWPIEQFQKHGIRYVQSDKTKSEIYLECLPIFMSRKVELLENRKLLAQLCSLERHSKSGGKDSVDHLPSTGAHDDLINSAAGCLLLASQGASSEESRQAFIKNSELILDFPQTPQRPSDRHPGLGVSDGIDWNLRGGTAMRNFERMRRP